MKTVDPNWLKRLRSALAYDPVTGDFRWKATRAPLAKAGDIAGTLDSKGHRQIRFEMKLYLAHRLAWVIIHGYWPDEVDHINRDRSDNRFCNLRECTHIQNSMNRGPYSSNTSGTPGVSWYPKYQKWTAYIRAGGKRRRHLGYFIEKQDAIDARMKAERELFGAFGAQHDVEFHEQQTRAA